MCEAHAYLVTEGGRDKIMENVITITYGDDGALVLTDLFGDEMRLQARIKEIALIEHKIYLEGV